MKHSRVRCWVYFPSFVKDFGNSCQQVAPIEMHGAVRHHQPPALVSPAESPTAFRAMLAGSRREGTGSKGTNPQPFTCAGSCRGWWRPHSHIAPTCSSSWSTASKAEQRCQRCETPPFDSPVLSKHCLYFNGRVFSDFPILELTSLVRARVRGHEQQAAAAPGAFGTILQCLLCFILDLSTQPPPALPALGCV